MVLEKFKLLLLIVAVASKIKCEIYLDAIVDSRNITAELVSSLIKAESSKNHDVALIRVELKNQSELFDIISTRVLKNHPGNSVFIHKTLETVTKYQIHASSIFVIVTDLTNYVRTQLIVNSNLTAANHSQTELRAYLMNIFRFNWWESYAKFIFVFVDEEMANFKLMAKFREMCRRMGMNKAVVTVPSGKVWTFEYPYKWRRIDNDSRLLDPFCKDCLRNMDLRVIVGRQAPRIYMEYGEHQYKGVDLMILEIIADRQNLTIFQRELLDYPTHPIIERSLNESSSDVSLLTSVFLDPDFGLKQINTNDENAYCALIPIPPPLTFLHFLLKPFDSWSWVVMMASIVACAVLWQRVTKSFKSTFDFMFLTFVSLVGQIVPLKVNKLLLKTILQICILMTFIVGNAYQSLIISYMTTSRDGIRLKTFDELFESDRTLVVDRLFRHYLNVSDFESAVNRTEIISSMTLSDYFGRNIAIIHRCDSLKFSMAREVTDDYYIMPDMFFKYLEKLYIAFQSPFYEIFQEMFDRTLETGIRQHWQKKLKPPDYAKQTRDARFISDEEYMLLLEDLHGVFLILGVGLGISFLIWVFEINWERMMRFKASCKVRRESFLSSCGTKFGSWYKDVSWASRCMIGFLEWLQRYKKYVFRK